MDYAFADRAPVGYMADDESPPLKFRRERRDEFHIRAAACRTA
jgi:hypothetical protein